MMAAIPPRCRWPARLGAKRVSHLPPARTCSGPVDVRRRGRFPAPVQTEQALRMRTAVRDGTRRGPRKQEFLQSSGCAAAHRHQAHEQEAGEQEADRSRRRKHAVMPPAKDAAAPQANRFEPCRPFNNRGGVFGQCRSTQRSRSVRRQIRDFTISEKAICSARPVCADNDGDYRSSQLSSSAAPRTSRTLGRS